MAGKFDTVNGAKIYFGPNADYDTFIGVVNIMNEEKMPTYMLFSNTMYAFAHAKPKPDKRRIFVCGTTEASIRNSRLMEEENQNNELHIFQKSFLKQQWLIILGYLGIVLINIFALVKFNKNKNYNQK